ncbi:MAG: TIGR02646 family protein [Candidatus Parabeggiatoa sp. nov. 3]|nr:MAG: TIGR02646 family protein [Gammaproteobacteria bacterium]RKZ69564.1 MAG: TIGR02646 family protein [Gammaproteobacteria bacterium]RKZ87465.1 MAG: TIGR02646 family protein [Gammaproteobacteria bacterium]HEW98739.1 TIGR02646 family protein [Beggiatoa sp.]
MKKIKQLHAVPTSLQRFLQEYFPPANRQVKDWEAFRNDDSGKTFRELIDALTKVQHGLCAYCEINLVKMIKGQPVYDREIEHFHPKSDISHQTDWMFEITNLFAACKGGSEVNIFGDKARSDYRDTARCLPPIKKNLSCGASKKYKILDNQILNPIQLPLSPPLFSVSIFNGAISVDENACHQAGINPEKAKSTIKALNLNCKRLCEVRKQILKKLDADYRQQRLTLGATASFAQIDTLLNQMVAQSLTVKPNGSLPAFFTTIRVFFGARAETFLAHLPQNGI